MKLWLDVHIPAAVIAALRRSLPQLDVVHVSEWHAGEFREADDETLLEMAASERCVLVTYDQRTIPTLLRRLAETGQEHAGVILCDNQTIAAHDVGGIAAALREWLARTARMNAANAVSYLRRSDS